MDSNRMSLLDDAITELSLYKKRIFSEIPKAIETKSFYLAALGLATLTEVFGGFYRGNLKQGNSKENYDKFITTFFPESYSQVNKELKLAGLTGLYKQVRCGLVHEYILSDHIIFIEKSSKSDTNCCGIDYIKNIMKDKKKKPFYLIRFIVEQYWNDFKGALDKYEERLKKEEYLLAKLECALDSIDSPLSRSNNLGFGK
jgi:hypothetical protein